MRCIHPQGRARGFNIGKDVVRSSHDLLQCWLLSQCLPRGEPPFWFEHRVSWIETRIFKSCVTAFGGNRIYVLPVSLQTDEVLELLVLKVIFVILQNVLKISARHRSFPRCVFYASECDDCIDDKGLSKTNIMQIYKQGATVSCISWYNTLHLMT
jgi:hypothetical protein